MTKKSLFRVFEEVFRWVYLIFPFIILPILGLYFLIYEVFLNHNIELTLDIFQVVIILLATLAVLCFSYASATTERTKKKKDIIFCGEAFLKATIIWIFGFMIMYLANYIQNSDANNIILSFLTPLFMPLINLVVFVLFFLTVKELHFAFLKILETITKNMDDYDMDDIIKTWKRIGEIKNEKQ